MNRRLTVTFLLGVISIFTVLPGTAFIASAAISDKDTVLVMKDGKIYKNTIK